MAHFAKLNDENIVTQVVVLNNNELIDENHNESEQKGIDFLTDWSGGHTKWKQTSYNANFRKNFAGVGYTYDERLDAFYSPQPFGSWIFNEDTCKWDAPVPYPGNESEVYYWFEESLQWIKYEEIPLSSMWDLNPDVNKIGQPNN